jgi:hypothetical protein
LIHRAYPYFQLLALLRFQIPWRDGFFLSLSLTNLLALIGVCGALLLLARRDRVSAATALRAIAALYIAMIAVAVTGDLPWHTVFAVPVLIAPLLVFVRAFGSHGPRQFVLGVALAAFLVVASATVDHRNTPEVWAAEHHEIQEGGSIRKLMAETLDALMDRCGYERFFPWGGYVSAYMRHSPYHMPYAELRAFGGRPNLRFQKKFFDDLSETPLIVGVEWPQVLVYSGGTLLSRFDPRVKRMVERDFTLSPPSCAQPFLPLLDDQFTLFFRRREVGAM